MISRVANKEVLFLRQNTAHRRHAPRTSATCECEGQARNSLRMFESY